jgi:hypothetical protein
MNRRELFSILIGAPAVLAAKPVAKRRVRLTYGDEVFPWPLHFEADSFNDDLNKKLHDALLGTR